MTEAVLKLQVAMVENISDFVKPKLKAWSVTDTLQNAWL